MIEAAARGRGAKAGMKCPHDVAECDPLLSYRRKDIAHAKPFPAAFKTGRLITDPLQAQAMLRPTSLLEGLAFCRGSATCWNDRVHLVCGVRRCSSIRDAIFTFLRVVDRVVHDELRF